MSKELDVFIERYVKEIRDNSAAVFIGAGFSKSSGYVDWKQLLESIANELELDINKENDLVSLAQYYFNKNQNRSVINGIIFEEFSQEKELSENHKILARLPIFTYWTTNYDSLIEDALKEIQKVVDIKYNNKQLSITKPHRDAVVYKMHGDKDNPDDTVILKDDYERYYHEHTPFITALSGDLISKTFLFIGFSFLDPNIDYILSRIRIDYGEGNRRQHYALMRKIKKSDFEETADYEYAARRHQLFIDDLKRYSINVLLIDEYSEITDILKKIERKINSNSIFISGSAAVYGIWKEDEASDFIKYLSKKLIQEGYNLVSGFGLGVGSFVITGALEEIYMKNKIINDNRLLLRPFPQGIENEETRIKLWTQYREDMISRSGISIFLFGNKLDPKTREVVLANGMMAEYEIAKEHGTAIVPVGCTGFVSEEIWKDLNQNISKFYPQADEDFCKSFQQLNMKNDYKIVTNNILEFLKRLK